MDDLNTSIMRLIYLIQNHVDTTTIDDEHAELKTRGFVFRTNTLSDQATIDHAKAWILGTDSDVDFIVHPQAYDIYGTLLDDCVSIWTKQREA